MSISSILSRTWFDPGQAVGFGDELGETDELVGLGDHRGEPAEALPQPQRVGEDRRVGRLAVEEHALVGDEDVVEDHEAVGHAVHTADGEVADVVAAWVERGVDDPHAGRVDRDRARDRVILLARLHRLRRHHHQVVHERGRADVQLGAADDDAVRACDRRRARTRRDRAAAPAAACGSPLASVMHSAIRMSRCVASSTYASSRSLYTGSTPLILGAAVRSVISEP